MSDSRLLTIIHPVTFPQKEKGLILFDYVIQENTENTIDIHLCTNPLILPSEEVMRAADPKLGVSNHLKPPYPDSLFLRNAQPYYIRHHEHIEILQELLVDEILNLLQYSQPSQQQNP